MKKKILSGAFSILLFAAASAQHPTIGGYKVYYGDLHNHSNVSDGTGTPSTAYSYAKYNAHFDFFCLTDHSESFSSTAWNNIKNQANTYNQDGVFTAFYGFEWSSNRYYGNVGIVNTDDYCTIASPTNTFAGLVTWLASRPAGIAFFNHPGKENYNGLEFSYFTTTPSDQFVGIELWNRGDAFNVYYYNDGYYQNDNNKGYYDEALERGWKIGATGAGDNHSGTWGMSYPYRMAILSNNLTRSDLLNAMRERRFFSTLDENLSLSFKINDKEMGSSVTGGNYNAQIQAADADGEIFTQVVIINKNHDVVKTWSLYTSSVNVSLKLDAYEDNYYYVKVRQADGDEAISSPIWTSAGPSNQYPYCSISSPSDKEIYTAPANIVIKADAYDNDGSISKVEFYEEDKKLGEDSSSPYSFKWNNVTPGSYILKVKAIDNLGAVTTSSEVTVTVNPRPITVTANTKTKVFGNPDPPLTFQITSGSLVETDSFSGALTRDAGENVGTYTIRQGTLTLNDNYIITYVEANLNITPKPITISADPKTKVYGEPDPVLTYRITSGSLPGIKSFTGALTRDAGENVGTYTIRQGTLSLNNNYAITYVEANLNITARPITIATDPKVKVYGEPDPALTFRITSGSLLGTDSFRGALTRQSGENAGVYAIRQGTLTLNNNYSITCVEANLDITAKPITIAIDPKTKVYGEPDPAFTYRITSGSLIGTDSLYVALTRESGENIGTYTIKQETLVFSDNYKITCIKANLEITSKPISIIADPKTKIYGESDPALTYQITSGSLIGTDSFSGALNRDSGENIGVYAIRQGTLVLSNNYTITYKEANLAITTRLVSVTADSKTKIFGEPDPALTHRITSGSLIGTDTFSGALTRDSGENVNSYTIKQGTLALNKNYSITYIQDNLVITAKPIIITADPKTKIYGEPDPGLTYQITSGSLVGTDTFNGQLTRNTGEGVGLYEITLGDLTLSDNYILIFEGANFNIMANLLIKAYPNPFTDHLYFDFELYNNSNISIDIFNSTGVKIANIFSGTIEANHYHFVYNPRHITNSILIYQISYNGKVITKGKVIHKK